MLLLQELVQAIFHETKACFVFKRNWRGEAVVACKARKQHQRAELSRPTPENTDLLINWAPSACLCFLGCKIDVRIEIWNLRLGNAVIIFAISFFSNSGRATATTTQNDI